MIDIEVKNFIDTTWRDNLDKMMSFDAVPKDSTFKAGQLFNDIVAFSQGVNKRYIFMPDVQASPDEILSHIRKLMLDKVHGKNLSDALEFSGDSEDWIDTVNDMIDEMKDKKFVEINSLSNLIVK